MKSRIFYFSALIAVSVLLATGCRSGAANTNANTASTPTTIDVTTTQAVVKPIPTYFEATGNLVGDESTDVAPVIAGKIAQVNFDVGSYVTKGSVLVRLDPRDAQLRLEQAEAQLVQQRRAEETAVAGLRQAQARLGIKEGDSYNVDSFSQVRSVKANLDLAEKELVRTQRLYNTGDASKSVLDQRRAQRDALLAQLEDARLAASVAVKAIDSAQAQVAAARSGIRTAQAVVDQARKAVSDTAILAPISGYISERVADPGEYVSPNAPNTKVATIVRTSVLRLKIDIPEASIGKVAAGQNISLQTSAYPDRSFAGKVARILPGLNATARTLTVEAEVPNGEGLLKPGQFATVRVTQPQPENAVMIPAAAVKADGDVNKVYIIKDGAAREHLVQVGLLVEDGMLQIKTGLAEGDVIATNNLSELYDGVLVRQMN